MAGIDHTIIAFKNGKFDRDCDFSIGGYKIKVNRDCEMYSIVLPGGNSVNKFKKYNDKWDYFYQERNLSYKIPHIIREFLKVVIPKKKVFNSCADYFIDGNIEIFCYKEGNFNCVFAISGNESVISIGGYGHYQNPYTHFHNRGYGEKFENEMLNECFEWLCSRIFKDVLMVINKEFLFEIDSDDKIKKYWGVFRFKDYWDMTEEEKKNTN